jgi:ribonuclease BN (tRNA processing enzyme)
MEVIFLGTGAPWAQGRQMVGLYVRAPGCEPLLVDTCGGFALIEQLRRAGIPPRSIRNVFVTHRHHDHAGGIPALLLGGLPLQVHGTPHTLAALRDLMRSGFPEWADPAGTAYVEVPARGMCEIGGLAVETVPVEHRVETVAVRVRAGGRTLAFGGDSLPCQGLVTAARGADLFVCDALWQGEGDLREAAHRLMHATAAEAAEAARAGEAAALALVHLGARADGAAMLGEAQAVFPGPVRIPDDLDRVWV